MRNWLIILFVLPSVQSFGQIVSDRGSNGITVRDWRLLAGYNAFLPRYVDTTAANLQKGIDSCGAEIYCYGTGMWYRECSPKRWVQLSNNLLSGTGISISGDTIYNTGVLNGVVNPDKLWFGNPIAAWSPGGLGEDRTAYVFFMDSLNPTDKKETAKFFIRSGFTSTPFSNYISEASSFTNFIRADNNQSWADVNTPAARAIGQYLIIEAGATGNIPVASVAYGRFDNNSSMVVTNSYLLNYRYLNNPNATVIGGITLTSVNSFGSNSVAFWNPGSDSWKMPQRGHYMLYDTMHVKSQLGYLLTDSIVSPKISVSNITTYGNTPTLTVNANAGTGATAIILDGDEVSGSFKITLGSGSISSSSDVLFITMNVSSLTRKPKSVTLTRTSTTGVTQFAGTTLLSWDQANSTNTLIKFNSSTNLSTLTNAVVAFSYIITE
jgi:hypothetical protein